MTISDNLRVALDGYNRSSYAGECGLNCYIDTVIPRQVVIDFTKDAIEIPTFICPRQIINNLSSNNYTKLVMPLNTGRPWTGVSSVEVLMKHICTTSYNDERLRKGIRNNGEVYFGGNGFLMDANYDVLMMVSRVLTTSDCIFRQYRIHLHPKLFTDEENPVGKILAKKAPYFYLSEIRDIPVEIVVNKSNNIIKPIISGPVTTDNIPKFLQENIADIIEQFKQI